MERPSIRWFPGRVGSRFSFFLSSPSPPSVKCVINTRALTSRHLQRPAARTWYLPVPGRRQSPHRVTSVGSVGPLPSIPGCASEAVCKWGSSLWLDAAEWCIAAASGQDTSHSHSYRSPINVCAWGSNSGALHGLQRGRQSFSGAPASGGKHNITAVFVCFIIFEVCLSAYN